RCSIECGGDTYSSLAPENPVIAQSVWLHAFADRHVSAIAATNGIPSRDDGLLPSAVLTRSGDMGTCRNLTPVSCVTAFPMAGATRGTDVCPTPAGGLSLRFSSTGIPGGGAWAAP